MRRTLPKIGGSSGSQVSRHDRLGLPEGRKTPLGFKEASGRYIERLSEEGGKNIKAKRRQLDQHLIPFFGGSPISQIGSFDVERYKKARRNSKAALATVNRELAVISHLFNKAVEWGWLKALPAKIRRFKEENTRIIYLTEPQCIDLLEAATHDQNENVHAFVMVGLRTGMRHSEILAIRRNDIDIGKCVIWIPKAKSGAREQPITQDLAEYLVGRFEMLPPGCEWLFLSPGSRTGHVHTIRKAFQRSVIRAGLDLDKIAPHAPAHSGDPPRSGWRRPANSPANIRPQDVDYGGALCTPERRTYSDGDVKLESRLQRLDQSTKA